MPIMLSAFLTALLSSGCFFGGSSSIPVAPEITSDGSGGAIFVWLDEVNKGNLYAQRLDGRGNPLWGWGGKKVCSINKKPTKPPFGGVGGPRFPQVAWNNTGGAIIAWADTRESSEDAFVWNTYAQRLDPQGRALWAEGGVDVSRFDVIGMTADGYGGAILLFYKRPEMAVYVQRVGRDGSCLWGAQGKQICNEAHAIKAIIDGAGGVVAVWEDSRGPDTDIYGQRLSADGQILWSENGIPLADGICAQLQPQIISDGKGNFIIAWLESPDKHNDIGNNDIYAQKINANGERLWPHRGIPVCTSPKNQSHHQLTTDASGGCMIAWLDARNRLPREVYAQRVSSNGEILWKVDGVSVWDISEITKSFPLASISHVQIVSDNASGAVVTWRVDPEPPNLFKGSQTYAQRLDAFGKPVWPAAGVKVYENPSLEYQGYSLALSDSKGGVIIASTVGSGWPQAQRISSDGKRLWGEGGVKVSQ